MMLRLLCGLQNKEWVLVQLMTYATTPTHSTTVSTYTLHVAPDHMAEVCDQIQVASTVQHDRGSDIWYYSC